MVNHNSIISIYLWFGFNTVRISTINDNIKNESLVIFTCVHLRIYMFVFNCDSIIELYPWFRFHSVIKIAINCANSWPGRA